MDKQELIALAENLCQAKAESHDMFMSAFHLAFPAPSQIWEDEEREEWTADYEKWHQLGWAFANFLDASAYLNAAMMLVPEECKIHCVGESEYLVDGTRPWLAMVVKRGGDLGKGETCYAATPALALCAASLRAIAEQEGE